MSTNFDSHEKDEAPVKGCAMDKHRVLKQYFGYDSFRTGQEHLIDTILSGRDVLGVMPTGAGKSICFQVPAMLLPGITIVVSPLISLMKDQVNSLTQAGIKAAFLNSSLTFAQYSLALKNARNHLYKIIYIAPERLLNEDFLSFARSIQISMITVDESHCISQWGQDFRPSYLKIIDFVKHLPNRPVFSAFTATATLQVREDILQRLQLKEPVTLVTGFDRQNLFFSVENPPDKLTALLYFLAKRKNKSGIVYCSTRKAVEEVCSRLQQEGYAAQRYHAGLEDQERKNNQDLFLFDRVSIMVATNAFGMGIDKSNVSFVVHYNMPGDIESYYQEAGRAGRDGQNADCLLLYSSKDVETQLYFINHRDSKEEPDKQTVELLKQQGIAKLNRMSAYCSTKDCLRQTILRYFGETAPECKDNCGNCLVQYESVDITSAALNILSCVQGMGERFGIKTIIDLLQGKQSARINNVKFEQLCNYNIMAHSDQELNELIQALILQDYLCLTNDHFLHLQLGSRAQELLSSRTPVKMKRRKRIQKIALKATKLKKREENEVDPVLLEQLKDLRLTVANEQCVPAYIIFTDDTLVEMCKRIPLTATEFLLVPGVSRAKYERYGQTFISSILKFIVSELSLSESHVFFSEFIEKIDRLLKQKGISSISTLKAAEWMIKKGYLENCGGTNFTTATEKGADLGIISRQTLSNLGTLHCSNKLNRSAQSFIAAHLDEIVVFARNKR